MDKTAEVEFFTDFGTLTAAFKPVAIGSLLDSQSTSRSTAKKYFVGGRFISKPTAIVRRFSICSILALLTLLYAQIVWISGTTILTEFQKLGVEWARVKDDQAKLAVTPEPKAANNGGGLTPQEAETPAVQLLEQSKRHRRHTLTRLC